MKTLIFRILTLSIYYSMFGYQSQATTSDFLHLSFPSSSVEHFRSNTVVGMDHDYKKSKSFGRKCNDFKGRGFPHCYGGHAGTDFLLRGGFKTMEKNIPVTAAAAGSVVYIRDGFEDHCRWNLWKWKIVCPGQEELRANYILIKQNDGLYAAYFHVMKNSMAVKVGQKVECGTVLAFVGSSGISATPHIHFEMRKINPDVILPENPDYFQVMMKSEPFDPFEHGLWRSYVSKNKSDGLPAFDCGS